MTGKTRRSPKLCRWTYIIYLGLLLVVIVGKTWVRNVNHTSIFKKILPQLYFKEVPSSTTYNRVLLYTLGGRGRLCLDIALVAGLAVWHSYICSLNSVALCDNPLRGFYCNQIPAKYFRCSYSPLRRIYLWNVSCCKTPDATRTIVLKPHCLLDSTTLCRQADSAQLASAGTAVFPFQLCWNFPFQCSHCWSYNCSSNGKKSERM